MFEFIEDVEQYIPQQRSVIIDLSIMPDETIGGIAEVKAFILALKYSRSPLLFEKLPQIIGSFRGTDEAGLKYFNVVMLYLKYCVSPEH